MSSIAWAILRKKAFNITIGVLQTTQNNLGRFITDTGKAYANDFTKAGIVFFCAQQIGVPRLEPPS